MYSDKLFANAVLQRSNKCVQILATDFGWSCSFPMMLKSEAHEELSLVIQQGGVSPTIICDNAMEMV